MTVTLTESLTILIPCFNEQQSVAAVVAEFKEAFPSAEIVVIDNGSDDGTAAAALNAGAKVLTEARRGKAHAIRTALSRIDSDIAIMVDGDGSYPAAGAERLVEEYYKSAADLITGVRLSEDPARDFRPMHRFGSAAFSLLILVLFKRQEADLFSGLRLFSRRFYKLVPILCGGFELEMELTVQAIDKGFSTAHVPVPFRQRTVGGVSKLRTLPDGLRILRYALAMVRDFYPMFFFSALAILFGLAALLAGFLPIREYFFLGFVGRFPLAILAASLGVISVVLWLAGVMLESGLRHHRERYQIEMRRYP